MIVARFRAFSPLHIHHSYTRKWMNLEGKCLIRRKTLAFSFSHCNQTVAPFDTPSAPLESSHRALKWVSISFPCFDTSLGHIFSMKGLFTSSKNRIYSLTTLVLGTPLCLLPRLRSYLFLSWATILYSCFYGPPLEPYYEAAPFTFPCLEHPSRVIITSMESTLSPFVPRYSPPSFLVWSLSLGAHYGLQYPCPLSLMILCQSLPSHSYPLCYNKGSRPTAPSYPPFHLIISVYLFFALLFSLVP